MGADNRYRYDKDSKKKTAEVEALKFQQKWKICI